MAEYRATLTTTFWNEVTGDVQWEDPGGVCSSAVIVVYVTPGPSGKAFSVPSTE